MNEKAREERPKYVNPWKFWRKSYKQKDNRKWVEMVVHVLQKLMTAPGQTKWPIFNRKMALNVAGGWQNMNEVIKPPQVGKTGLSIWFIQPPKMKE